jgi:hypothetical protein
MRISRVATLGVSAAAGSVAALLLVSVRSDSAGDPRGIQSRRHRDGRAARRRTVSTDSAPEREKILTTFITDTSFRAYDGDGGWLQRSTTFACRMPPRSAAAQRQHPPGLDVDRLVLDPSGGGVENAAGISGSFTDSAGHGQRLRVTQTMVWTRRAEVADRASAFVGGGGLARSASFRVVTDPILQPKVTCAERMSL